MWEVYSCGERNDYFIEKQFISYRRVIHYSGNPRIHIVELALEDVAL